MEEDVAFVVDNGHKGIFVFCEVECFGHGFLNGVAVVGCKVSNIGVTQLQKIGISGVGSGDIAHPVPLLESLLVL